MNNCLVNKLKGTVDNSSLSKLGVLKLKATKGVVTDSERQQKIEITCSVDTTVTVDGVGYVALSLAELDSQSKTVSIPANTNTAVYFSNDTYNIFVNNKYDIKSLVVANTGNSSQKNIVSIDDEGISFLTGLQTISYSYNSGILAFDSVFSNNSKLRQIYLTNTEIAGTISVLNQKVPLLNVLQIVNTNVSGDIANLRNLNLTELGLRYTNVFGDISVFNSLTRIPGLNVQHTSVSGDISQLSDRTYTTYIDVNNTQVSGDIASLGKLTNLTELWCSNTNMTGSVEEFVAAQRANGRTSCNNFSFNSLKQISFGGSTRNEDYAYIFWDATRIWIYAGASGYQNCNKVYTKGYSQSEAEAAFPGKTIIRVDA